MDQEKSWYVFKITSRHEKKAEAYLNTKGIECYLPLSSKKRKWSDRIKLIDFPLFPGYLFVHINWEENRNDIFKAPGVFGFIRNEKGPIVMPDKDIETIKALVSSARDLKVASLENFPAGHPIRIVFGSLKGLEGTVDTVKNNRFLFVKMKLLGQMIRVQMDVDDVEKVLY